MKIAILPVGSVILDVLEFVQENLIKAFPWVEVSIQNGSMMLPQEAFHRLRRQYESSLILALVREYVNKINADKILGITDADLYVPELNFVFGEAECPGKAALVSLCRLKPESFSNQADKTLFIERVAKEALHEIGHTFGLAHCSDPSCVMFFSNTIKDVDRKRPERCKECSKRLLALIR